MPRNDLKDSLIKLVQSARGEYVTVKRETLLEALGESTASKPTKKETKNDAGNKPEV